MKYPYAILGVPENATQQEIRQAYLELLRKFPPEQAPDKFQELRDAWQLVADDVARARLAVFGLQFHPHPPPKPSSILPETSALPRRPGTAFWRKLLANTEPTHD